MDITWTFGNSSTARYRRGCTRRTPPNRTHNRWSPADAHRSSSSGSLCRSAVLPTRVCSGPAAPRPSVSGARPHRWRPGTAAASWNGVETGQLSCLSRVRVHTGPDTRTRPRVSSWNKSRWQWGVSLDSEQELGGFRGGRVRLATQKRSRVKGG